MTQSTGSLVLADLTTLPSTFIRPLRTIVSTWIQTQTRAHETGRLCCARMRTTRAFHIVSIEPAREHEDNRGSNSTNSTNSTLLDLRDIPLWWWAETTLQTIREQQWYMTTPPRGSPVHLTLTQYYTVVRQNSRPRSGHTSTPQTIQWELKRNRQTVDLIVSCMPMCAKCIHYHRIIRYLHPNPFNWLLCIEIQTSFWFFTRKSKNGAARRMVRCKCYYESGGKGEIRPLVLARTGMFCHKQKRYVTVEIYPCLFLSSPKSCRQ